MKDLVLDDHARKKLIELVEDRYDPETDELTIVADRYSCYRHLLLLWVAPKRSVLKQSLVTAGGVACEYSRLSLLPVVRNEMREREREHCERLSPVVAGSSWKQLYLQATGDDKKQQLHSYFIG